MMSIFTDEEMQSIFKWLPSSHKHGDLYPMNELEDLATKYATRASTSYQRLHDIILRHEEVIRKRYKQSYATEAKRRELLLSVWPDVAGKHLSSSFEDTTGKFVPTPAKSISKSTLPSLVSSSRKM